MVYICLLPSVPPLMLCQSTQKMCAYIGTGKVLSCLQVLNYVAEKVYMGNYEKGVRTRD